MISQGTVSENGEFSKVLQDIKLILYDPRFCSQTAINPDWTKQICAGKNIYSSNENFIQN